MPDKTFTITDAQSAVLDREAERQSNDDNTYTADDLIARYVAKQLERLEALHRQADFDALTDAQKDKAIADAK